MSLYYPGKTEKSSEGSLVLCTVLACFLDSFFKNTTWKCFVSLQTTSQVNIYLHMLSLSLAHCSLDSIEQIEGMVGYNPQQTWALSSQSLLVLME